MCLDSFLLGYTQPPPPHLTPVYITTLLLFWTHTTVLLLTKIWVKVLKRIVNKTCYKIFVTSDTNLNFNGGL